MKLETSVEALIKEDPLLAGAAVFAAGAAIGMAIPRSGKNAWFGKGREAVVHKVQDMAHDAFEKVESVVQAAKGNGASTSNHSASSSSQAAH